MTTQQFKRGWHCSNCQATESKMERFGHDWWERWDETVERSVKARKHYHMRKFTVTHHYCSLECYHAHANKWTEKRTCDVCKHHDYHSKRDDWDWNSLSGRDYCSDECYSTLFWECNECHKSNMTARNNALRAFAWGYPKEQLCDTCYKKKHNLASVMLKFG